MRVYILLFAATLFACGDDYGCEKRGDVYVCPADAPLPVVAKPPKPPEVPGDVDTDSDSDSGKKPKPCR